MQAPRSDIIIRREVRDRAFIGAAGKVDTLRTMFWMLQSIEASEMQKLA